MAKNSIRDYDATSGNNTDVQSVDISEGCAASGINNAIREVMADLKDVSTGTVNLETPAADRLDVDNIRIDGNTISSTDTNGDLTLSPNGTGAVGINTTSPTGKLDVEDTAGSLGSTKDITAEFMRNDGTYGPRLQVRHSTDGTDLHHTFSTSASNLTFSNAGTERLRITSGGDITAGGEGGGTNTIDLRQGSVKAWHYAESSASLNDSYNISSTSDQGTGNYDFNFTNNMGNGNYSITANSSYAEIAQPESGRSTSTFTIRVFGRQDSLNNADQRTNAQIGGDIA